MKIKNFYDLKNFSFVFVDKFQGDRTMTMAASLAFYAILSLTPISVLLLFGLSKLSENLLNNFIEQANALVGFSGGSAIELAIRSAKDRPISGSLASLASLAVVLFSSGTMFSELRESLSIILRCGKKKDPPVHFIHATWYLLRDRLLSITFALVFVFGIATFLVLTTFISAIAEKFGVLHLELPISLALYTGIFSMLFMYGTHDGLKFRDAWKGALFTAILFIGGKTLIGFYIGNSTSAGSYGAAGSLVALLLWIFCASVIIFAGAQVGWLLSPRGESYFAKPAELDDSGLRKVS